MRTSPALSDLLPAIDEAQNGEYVIGQTRLGDPEFLRLNGSGRRFIRIDHAPDHPGLAPARRTLNLIAAQALNRNMPVFAARSFLPLCKDGNVRPISEARPWLYATRDERTAFFVQEAGSLRVEESNPIDRPFISVVVAPTDASDEQLQNPTHHIRPRSPRVPDDDLLRLQTGSEGVWFHPPRTNGQAPI